MRASNKRLTVLSELEKFALYGIPDFTEVQRTEFLTFTEPELNLILSRPDLTLQVYCAIQLGYFKAKQLFFRLPWENIVEDDISFIIQHYFTDQTIDKTPITKHEYYFQCSAIASLFEYRPWSKDFTHLLYQHATQAVQIDVTPRFIALELISYLKKQKIIRPGYSTLQNMISTILTKERHRLYQIITKAIDEPTKNSFKKLLQRDDSLSELAVLKQDAKNFKFGMMALEREKRDILQPFYLLSKQILPRLNISKQNILYYSSLANFYTVYELRTLPAWQTQLYLLCYAWQRYQQFNDNLIDAIGYHITQFNKATKEEAKDIFLKVSQKQKSKLIGKLLWFFVDDNTFGDALPFGEIRKQAFNIMPKEDINATSKQLCAKQNTQLFYRWQAIDKCVRKFKKHLRPLFMTLNFANTNEASSPWLEALNWFKQCFPFQKNIGSRPLTECPENTIPHRLEPYLYKKDPTLSLHADRYEIWIYQQLYKRFHAGAIHLEDSIHHKSFKEELISKTKKATVIKQLDIPWFQKPITQQLDSLFADLHDLWALFNTSLQQGKLNHLGFDEKTQTLTWHKPRANKEEILKQRFYSKIPARDVTDVLRWVNKKCDFLSAFTPLQPLFAKQVAKEENLLAVLTAQATNRGNYKMSEICDVSYSELETTYQQCFRLATLKEANNIIVNAISELPIFPHYSLDLIELYGPIDGQKYFTHRPTIRARASRKYFRKGTGVVAFTLLVNHAAISSEIIGAHDPESYFAFDIYYNNTSKIIPTVITGDMHALNKVNFALMYCFGPRFEVRFTSLQDQLKHLYCGYDRSRYKDYLIKPAGQIDYKLIVNEKENIDTIIATLGQKGITQSDLVRKMCTHTQNATFKAIFELDKLIRSIYTLKYLLDPQLERKVHRSQNQIESYHQLRATIARVGGEKELAGRSDIAVEISNQCGRLFANGINYYNSSILSLAYEKCEEGKNTKALALIKKTPPIAWQHLHFDGHYTFCGDDENIINLDEIVANLILE